MEPSLTGEILAKTIIQFLEKYKVDLNFCVAIGTDTCNVMIGEQKGAVAWLKQNLPNAIKCHCMSHSLNLSISKCNNVQDVKNAVGIIKEVVAFINNSS